MKQKGKKNKGKRGEIEAAEFLNTLFPDIRASRGHYPDPDIAHKYTGLHFEVKRVERPRLYDFVTQATEDANDGEVPIVLFRQNRKPWLAIIPLDRLPLDRMRHE